jgi:hypothetical protein
MSQATSGAELPSALGKFYLMRGGPIYRLMVTLRLEASNTHTWAAARSC